jgi:hypothetical protein
MSGTTETWLRSEYANPDEWSMTLRAKALRESTRLEAELAEDARELRDNFMTFKARKVQVQAEIYGDLTSLKKSVIESTTRENMNLLDNYVRRLNSIDKNQTNLVSDLGSSGIEAVQKAVAAYELAVPGSTAANRYKAVWEAVLGTSTSISRIHEGDPASHYILQEAQRLAGRAFNPAEFTDTTTTQSYGRLSRAATRQKNAQELYTRRMTGTRQTLQSALKSKTEGNLSDASKHLATLGGQLTDVRQSVDNSTVDGAWLGARVKAALEADPDRAVRVERARKLFEIATGEKDAPGADNLRTAMAAFLAAPNTKPWAESMGLNVGNATIGPNGEVLTFNPGEDLTEALLLAQKQAALAPGRGDKGPLVYRRGPRHLVRVTKKDGTVLMGKQLPMLSSDKPGDIRLSTSGGEVFLKNEDVTKRDVLKVDKPFSLGDQFKKAAGSFDALRAEQRLEDLRARREAPLPEAVDEGFPTEDPDDEMLEWEKANADVAEAERRLKMTNPEDKAATKAAQAALVAARDKVRTLLPPTTPSPDDLGDDPPAKVKVTEGAGPRAEVEDVGTAVRKHRARMSKARLLERQAEARRLHIEEAKGTKPSRRSRRADEKGVEDYEPGKKTAAELRKLEEQTKPGEHGAAQEAMLKHLMQSPGSQVADEEVPSKTTLLKAADKKRKRKGKKPIMTDWPM